MMPTDALTRPQISLNEASFDPVKWTENDRAAFIACIEKYFEETQSTDFNDRYTLLGSMEPAKNPHKAVVSYELPDGRHFHLMSTLAIKAGWGNSTLEQFCTEAVGIECYGFQSCEIKSVAKNIYLVTAKDG